MYLDVVCQLYQRLTNCDLCHHHSCFCTKECSTIEHSLKGKFVKDLLASQQMDLHLLLWALVRHKV